MNTQATLPGLESIVAPFRFKATPYSYKIIPLKEALATEQQTLCDTPDTAAAYWRANCRLPTANCRLPTADCRLPTANCRLPTANCPLPTAHSYEKRSLLRNGAISIFPIIPGLVSHLILGD